MRECDTAAYIFCTGNMALRNALGGRVLRRRQFTITSLPITPREPMWA